MWFKLIFSLTFFVMVVIYTFFKNIKIDTTTIVLVLMIFLPWIVKYLKSLELNGIGKIELISEEERQRLNEKVNKIENNNNSIEIEEKYLNFDDMKLSLAALRIDIEEKLQKIAQKNQLNANRYGIMKLSSLLYDHRCINNSEYMIIIEIIGILYKAVHSRLYDYDLNSYNSIIKIASKLISSLDDKILCEYI